MSLSSKSLVTISAAFAIAAGCSTEVLNPVDLIGEADGGSGGELAAGGGGSGGDGGATETYTRQTINGEVTWTVTFDDVAKMAGATDCSYTRRYQGVEDGSAPWLCPTCDRTYRADVEVVAGLDDCYSQVTTGTPAELEWLGEANGTWFRGVGARMSEQGTAAIDGAMVSVVNDVPDIEAPVGGTLSFAVAGELTIGEEDGDPLNGFRVPETYACGWPKADPPAYTGDYTLAVGGVMPDGHFKDACDETVRLHDLAGDYLIVDMSAIDCPPCRQMAATEEQFVSDMADEGITVHVVTLLAPSLDNTLGETTLAMLQGWRDSFQLTSPVLGDRGWGLTMFLPAIGDQTGYPSWMIVTPDLEVLDFSTGFGTWASFRSAILEHAAAP